MNKTKNSFSEEIINNTKDVLEFLDSDPKAQKLLVLYHSMPEHGKDTMLLVMDAFIAGIKAGSEKDAD